MRAGKLKHRIVLQRLSSDGYDPETGDEVTQWVDVATVWASVEPLSAREFIQAQSEQSQITARITIRYRSDITPDMRIVYKNELYDIRGLLEDKDSGMDYITIPVAKNLSKTGQ